ncbi:MAG TPA: nuclear transport factor 2 family protein [Acidimicrobiales bacterium]|nr:nuclear transport factor 2 family protein [Acidimicrobiales bacterium]
MDWQAWAATTQVALAVGSERRFRDLFAPGGTFSDPVTPATTDIESIEQVTESAFPDWRQEITSIRGDGTSCAFEWVGRGTLGGTTPIRIEGCTVVAVDDAGRVTAWRDYFDLQAVERQARAASEDPTE